MRGHYHWPLAIAVEGAIDRLRARIIRAIDGVAPEPEPKPKRRRKPRIVQETKTASVRIVKLIARNDNLTLLTNKETQS